MKCELYHDSFQNWRSYEIQKAQLIIADIPYGMSDKPNTLTKWDMRKDDGQ